MDPSISILVIGIIASIIIVFPQWHDSKHKWALVTGAILSIVMTWFAYKGTLAAADATKAQTDTLTKNLKETYSISKIQKQSLDTALSILNKQNTLNSLYERISDLQNKQIMELLGGDTPPTLIIEAEVVSNKLFLWEPTAVDSPIYFGIFRFKLKNESKYYLKSVDFTLSHPNFFLTNEDRVLKKNQPYNFDVFHEMTYNKFYFNFPPTKIKDGFQILVPLNYANYFFEVVVEWNNGDYKCSPSIHFENTGNIKKSIFSLNPMNFYKADTGVPLTVKYQFTGSNEL